MIKDETIVRRELQWTQFLYRQLQGRVMETDMELYGMWIAYTQSLIENEKRVMQEIKSVERNKDARNSETKRTDSPARKRT